MILIKLNSTNFLVWQNQIIHLIYDTNVLHYLLNGEKPVEEFRMMRKTSNTSYKLTMTNFSFHKFLKPWKKMFSTWIFVLTWNMRQELLLKNNCFMLLLKRKNLKKYVDDSNKKSWSFEEYLKDFKNIKINFKPR